MKYCFSRDGLFELDEKGEGDLEPDSVQDLFLGLDWTTWYLVFLCVFSLGGILLNVTG